MSIQFAQHLDQCRSFVQIVGVRILLHGLTVLVVLQEGQAVCPLDTVCKNIAVTVPKCFSREFFKNWFKLW